MSVVYFVSVMAMSLLVVMSVVAEGSPREAQ